MAAGPSFKVADPAGALLGEGPIWLAEEGAVYWVDIKSGVLNRYRPQDGAIGRWKVSDYLAWVVPRQNGPGFVAGTRREIGVLRVDALEAVFERRVAVAEPHPDNRLNDAKADHHGTIWFGTMDNAEQEGTGGFYRLAEDFSFVLADHGYVVANGPATSPDNQTIYHTDSAARTVYRFTRDADGHVGERSVFVTFGEADGYPDGMTTDAEGGVWIAHWGGGRVTRFLPDGTRERSFSLPVSQVSSCCFGGPELDRLFVTSASIGLAPGAEPLAGALFELDPGMRGLQPHRFAG